VPRAPLFRIKGTSVYLKENVTSSSLRVKHEASCTTAVYCITTTAFSCTTTPDHYFLLAVLGILGILGSVPRLTAGT